MKLKPCPFCGGEAELIQEDIAGLYAVNCKECKCRTPFQFDFGEGSEKKALKVWNRREPIDKVVEQLESELYKGMESLEPVRISFNFGINKAIEIVKKGGVSDEESKG